MINIHTRITYRSAETVPSVAVASAVEGASFTAPLTVVPVVAAVDSAVIAVVVAVVVAVVAVVGAVSGVGVSGGLLSSATAWARLSVDAGRIEGIEQRNEGNRSKAFGTASRSVTYTRKYCARMATKVTVNQ